MKINNFHQSTKILQQIGIALLLVFLFWLLIFDLQRIVFSIHNIMKFHDINFFTWLRAFLSSLRLDLSTAAYLSFLPLFFVFIGICWQQKWAFICFKVVLWTELVVCTMIHAGEVNAYPEWNHKLTGRVFMHLTHPDEVVRTADWHMTLLFVVYTSIELFIAYWIQRCFFRKLLRLSEQKNNLVFKIVISVIGIPFVGAMCFVLARGGLQPIPINTDSAIYTKSYVANDLAINSTYFFAKSYMLYKRTNLDDFFPKINEQQRTEIEQKLFDYPLKHENFIFNIEQPNFVFIVLESWTANAIGSLTNTPSATPNFDKLTRDGLFFTNIYGASGTSEIGNAAIFSAYPGIPEISITMQADKHRKIPSFNQELKPKGYISAYLFSGDLKYGNIGGYLSDHGFDIVEDEKNFPKHLKKGKLNYFDEDLYKLMSEKIKKIPQPFMQCAFTGSTHSPYDYPNAEKHKQFKGVEGNFLNSLTYADSCLNVFLEQAKKESWYENTIFVLVADHGHASNVQQNPSESAYNRIPLLIFGQPLKEEYKGKRIEHLGSQIDIARTLSFQIGGDFQQYRWAKDLLNPNAPQYALHTINRGFGWITPHGNFTYQMIDKQIIENTYNPKDFKQEFETCKTLLSLIYEEYKNL